MGVAGSGKSTVGGLLADRMGVAYGDGDDFHPAANVAAMTSGVALTDEDRWPWLDAVGTWLAAHEHPGAVVSCSALRRVYRDRLRVAVPDLTFLHLDGPLTLMTERVGGRSDHFMPAELVASQLATLEPPGPDERAVTVDAAEAPEVIVDRFLAVAGGR